MLASLLYKAAEDDGYVDPNIVQATLGVSQQQLKLSQKKKIMVDLENRPPLTPRQIARLAANISGQSMKSIAAGYMDISPETIKNIQYERGFDVEEFNRTIIKYWVNTNPEHQVAVSYNSSNVNYCCL